MSDTSRWAKLTDKPEQSPIQENKKEIKAVVKVILAELAIAVIGIQILRHQARTGASSMSETSVAMLAWILTALWIFVTISVHAGTFRSPMKTRMKVLWWLAFAEAVGFLLAIVL